MRWGHGIRVLVSLAAIAAMGCGGSRALSVRTLPATTGAIGELEQGRVDAVVGDYPALAYAARESMGTLEVVGPHPDTRHYGIAVPKNAPGLRAAVTAALRQRMQEGTYKRILRDWAIDVGEVDAPADPGSVPPADQILQIEDGTLHVGMEMSFPPMAFYGAQRRPAGVDVELAGALAETMGVELERVEMGRDGLVEAVRSGQIDVAISSITITAERSRQVDFVPYLEVGSGILVTLGNPEGILYPRDLCGKTVAVREGTSHLKVLEGLRCD